MSIDEDIEKRKPLHTVNDSVNEYGIMKNGMVVPQKTENTTLI